jgi:hypothetical protein
MEGLFIIKAADAVPRELATQGAAPVSLVCQLDALEQILSLRPYTIANHCILFELEEKVQDDFTLADLIQFSDGAEKFVSDKYGAKGVDLISSKEHWVGAVNFHKELARLWEDLGPEVKKNVCSGNTLASVLQDLELDLAAKNKELCKVSAKFSF